MLQIANYKDPSPSRLRYKFERLWLKPSFRRVFSLWIPMAVLGTTTWYVWSNPELNAYASQQWNDARETVAARPELQVGTVTFPDTSAQLRDQIMMITALEFPVSSLDLDVANIKASIELLDAVKSAEVVVLGGGILEIRTVERLPVMLWRDGEILRLLDPEGMRVAEVSSRNTFPTLPLIVGDGADAAMAEAVGILENSGPISIRIRGLVRVGARRWDVVLDRGQTIMLPEIGAITALGKVLELHNTQDLLNRDVVLIDMRDVGRPVLRLTDTAISELRRLRAVARGEDA